MVGTDQVVAIIAAGGVGSRMGEATGQSRGKQLLDVAGRPLAGWAVQAVSDVPSVDRVIVVCDPQRVEEYAVALTDCVAGDTPLSFAAGGKTRADSVYNGLEALDGEALDGEALGREKTDGEALDREALYGEGADRSRTRANPIVLIHDGARPLATPALMEAMIHAFVADPSADGMVIGHPCSDTIKHIDGMRVIDTPPRAQYWAVQTPQIFRRDTLLEAYSTARFSDSEVTDDASLVEQAAGRVVVYLGPRDNIKVTGPEDVAFVEAALRERNQDAHRHGI